MASTAGSTASGALGGAGKGAAVGTMIAPGIGTAIGAGVGAIIGGIGGFLKGKSANEAEKANRLLYNEWLKDRSATADQLAARLAERGIDIYGPQVTTNTQSGQSYMQTVVDQTTKPIWGSADKVVLNASRDIIQGRLNQPAAISEGEKFRQLANIVRTFEPAQTAEQNVAARFGGTNVGQAAGVGSPAARDAAGARLDYLASIPEQERQRREADLGLASNFLNMTKGQRTQGTTTSTGSTSGTSTSTAPPDLASLFNIFAPPAPQQSMNTGYSPTGDALSQGGSLITNLAGLYGQAKAGQPGGTPMTMPGPDVVNWGSPGGAGWVPPPIPLGGRR